MIMANSLGRWTGVPSKFGSEENRSGLHGIAQSGSDRTAHAIGDFGILKKIMMIAEQTERHPSAMIRWSKRRTGAGFAFVFFLVVARPAARTQAPATWRPWWRGKIGAGGES